MNPFNYNLRGIASDYLMETLQASDDNPLDTLIRLETRVQRELEAEGLTLTAERLHERMDDAFHQWCAYNN